MKKLIKSVATLAVLAAAAGGIYYFFKGKCENKEALDNFDDLDDFDDLSDLDEEEEKAADTEDERGYVTLKIHKDEETAEEQKA